MFIQFFFPLTSFFLPAFFPAREVHVSFPLLPHVTCSVFPSSHVFSSCEVYVSSCLTAVYTKPTSAQVPDLLPDSVPTWLLY